MSLRNVKKVQEAKSTQGEYYGSDDDFEPLCVQKSSKSTYEGHLLSNSSGDENKDKEAALTDTETENNLNTKEVEILNLLEESKGTENSKPECTQLEKKKKKKKRLYENECVFNMIEKMSLRNITNVQEAKSTQGEYYDSDDDFEPLCAQKSPKSTYEGLLLDKETENNLNTEEVEMLNLLEEGKGTENSKPECTQLEKKKKKKKQKRTKKHVTGDIVDEIDKALSEVNAMLGEPSKPCDYINLKVQEVRLLNKQNKIAKTCLFTVSRRHLNSSNELSSLFGPESDNEPRKKHGRRPNLKRIHRCKIIHEEFSFTKLGEKGLTYFVYDHKKEYKKLYREFMSVIALRNTNLLAPIETSLKGMHVEGLIEASDVKFRIEGNTADSDIIEQAIANLLIY